MPTYSSALLPTTNGLTFGSAALRWTAYLQDMDVAGTPTFTGRTGIKNLEDIRFADQYTGTVTQQIDAALADVSTGLVVAPSTMGAGSPTTVNASQFFLDLRSGFRLYCGAAPPLPPAIQLVSGALVFNALKSGGTNPAQTGQIRFANNESINWRNVANSGNIVGIRLNASDVLTLGGAAGISTSGNALISGDLTANTINCGVQFISSVATGTAPLSITSTTLVPNLNVSTLNGVTVSGAPTTGQVLTATGVATASWGVGGQYKLESMQYTPNTFVSSAGGALFTYSLPANELAVGQALRITASGTYTNTSVATRTFAFTVKAGSTTLGGFSIFASSGSVTNKHWSAEFLLICTAAGSSGTVEFQNITPVVTLSGMTNPTDVTITANAATIAFDTTSIQSLTLNIAQTNDATTSSTGRQFMVERIG